MITYLRNCFCPQSLFPKLAPQWTLQSGCVAYCSMHRVLKMLLPKNVLAQAPRVRLVCCLCCSRRLRAKLRLHFRSSNQKGRFLIFLSARGQMPVNALCTVCLGIGQFNSKGHCRYCVACRGPWYCSFACQRTHWGQGHRRECSARSVHRLLRDCMREKWSTMPENVRRKIYQYAQVTDKELIVEQTADPQKNTKVKKRKDNDSM